MDRVAFLCCCSAWIWIDSLTFMTVVLRQRRCNGCATLRSHLSSFSLVHDFFPFAHKLITRQLIPRCDFSEMLAVGVHQKTSVSSPILCTDFLYMLLKFVVVRQNWSKKNASALSSQFLASGPPRTPASWSICGHSPQRVFTVRPAESRQVQGGAFRSKCQVQHFLLEILASLGFGVNKEWVLVLLFFPALQTGKRRTWIQNSELKRNQRKTCISGGREMPPEKLPGITNPGLWHQWHQNGPDKPSKSQSLWWTE